MDDVQRVLEILYPRAERDFGLVGLAQTGSIRMGAPRFALCPHTPARCGGVKDNLALDIVRRKSPPVNAPAQSESFEDDVALRLALGEALRALPERQREAIVLRYLAGLTRAEVAAALGVSKATAATHLTRGMAALRRHLKEEVVVSVKRVADLRKGEHVSGRVSSIVAFGAFIEVGPDVYGLVHVSEMQRTVAMDEEVTVEVLDTDVERGRISFRLVS